MIQVHEPTSTAMIQNEPDRIRSITDPEMIDAAVHENSRKAAQNTPLMRAQPAVSSAVSQACEGAPPICAPISSLSAVAQGASSSGPTIHGPFGKAK